MLKITKNYRSEYKGEDIVTERVYDHQQWHSQTEYVPNAVFNYQISKQAVVIGNGLTQKDFDVNIIMKHQGGLLGETRLQTYGCNALFRDYKPDFLVITDRVIAEEAVLNGYAKDHICYSRANILLEFPKRFYLTPMDPVTDAGTTAAYIACFDGHKKVFMLGIDGQDTYNFNYNVYCNTNGYDSKNHDIKDFKWVADKAILFHTYDDVEFIWVTKTGMHNIPEAWKECPNFRQVNTREFVLEGNL